jgi:short-subunit dehydrogenase
MMLRVVITGASSGIGAALAREYARRGATLGLLARREQALQGLLRELACPIAVYPVDVRDAAAVSAAARDFHAQFGGADVVIASAGVSTGTSTERDEDHAVFQEIFDINVIGMVNTFAPFVAPMRAAGAGTLVGIASVAGFRGLPGSSAYSASKAAAITYLESLRVELHGSGVAVVTICPGFIATPMTEKNPYRMPFLMPADRAAQRMARAIDRRQRFTVIPWQMGIVGALLKITPRPVYDALFAKAPRKPQRNDR